MRITNDIYSDCLHCSYKAYLKISGKNGKKTDFELIQDKISEDYKVSTINYLRNKYESSEIISDLSLNQFGGHVYTKGFNIRERNSKFDVLFDGIIKENKSSSDFIPIIFINKNSPNINDKLNLAFCGFVLGISSGKTPPFGRIIYGSNYSDLRVSLGKLIIRVRLIVERIESFTNSKNPPQLFINKHCQVCEFGVECLEAAKKVDALSLLGGIDSKKIKKLNSKGIFTVNQLSYTFRPRRKSKSNPYRKNPYRPELKALSLRENKVYVYVTPELPNLDTEIFMDVESLPDHDFFYLVGLLINNKGTISEYSFWADCKDHEFSVFLNTLGVIEKYDNCVIYHYGQFEKKYLKRMVNKLHKDRIEAARKVLDRCYNILEIFHSNVYTPTYTNGLKDIAGYLGFEWKSKESSGIQSIVWRMDWEGKKTDNIKNTLIRYNMDDCYALKIVKDFISLISKNEGINGYQGRDIVFHKDMKRESPFKFLTGDFADPVIEKIHKYSLFDYQRQRVFVRTDEFIKESEKARKKKKKSILKPNTTRVISARVCAICNSQDIYPLGAISKRIIDLKITKSCIKRWITKLTSNTYKCRSCSKSFLPKGYIRSHENYAPKGYRKGYTKYGHMIKSWVIYQHIVNNQSFRKIETDLYEYFNLSINKSTLHEFKNYIVRYYRPTYKLLIKKILDSDVLYVDETPLKMKNENGYAWVLTNNREIVSIYQRTREGDFLKDLLSEYKGVLVSDFYAAYDSIDCIHQKCLIHLIRDMNDDLLKNPFNEELTFVTQNFTNLLQRIVKTIDKFGLKKERLIKYNTDVEGLFTSVAKHEFKTEIGIYYQDRFWRNRKSLFEFIKHDNVSWNNNNAEKAIKLLATHTNRKILLFSEDRMCEYLQISSIYQTCVYNKISFLKFLLSKEKDLDRFIKGIYKLNKPR